jgi:5-methylcytosine-specific restriction protein A
MPVSFKCQPGYAASNQAKEKIMIPSAWDFQNQLTAILNGARGNGKSYVDIKSGNLHKKAGGYPNSNHRMGVCCEVMKRMMRAGDSVLSESPSGQGATLLIRYIV